MRDSGIEHGEGYCLPFTDREPAHSVTIEAHSGQRNGGCGSQLGIDAALHDAEQPVAGPSHEGLLGTVGPAER